MCLNSVNSSSPLDEFALVAFHIGDLRRRLKNGHALQVPGNRSKSFGKKESCPQGCPQIRWTTFQTAGFNLPESRAKTGGL